MIFHSFLGIDIIVSDNPPPDDSSKRLSKLVNFGINRTDNVNTTNVIIPSERIINKLCVHMEILKKISN
jgi:hypothetical protein